MPDRSVVSNTSPLLYLYQVGQLDLLRGLYGRVRIPPAVQAELRAGEEQGIPVPRVEETGWLEVHGAPDLRILPAIVDLGRGEAEAIALALASDPPSLLILDDSLGRRIAHLSGLTFTGTLGVLVKAKRAGLLANLTPVIDSLRRTTMHLTPRLIESVLLEAGEKSQ